MVGNDHARGKRPQVERLEVKCAGDLGVGGIEELETSINPKPINEIGDHPATDTISGLNDGHVDVGAIEHLRTSKSGQTCTNDDH
jgi:hypothetical protein